MTPAEDTGLREFISEELGKVHSRMELMHDGQLNFQGHVAGHFGTVYTRLDDVSTRLDGVITRLDDVSTRLSRVETQFEEMRGDFRAFGEGLGSTNRRMEELRFDPFTHVVVC